MTAHAGDNQAYIQHLEAVLKLADDGEFKQRVDNLRTTDNKLRELLQQDHAHFLSSLRSIDRTSQLAENTNFNREKLDLQNAKIKVAQRYRHIIKEIELKAKQSQEAAQAAPRYHNAVNQVQANISHPPGQQPGKVNPGRGSKRAQNMAAAGRGQPSSKKSPLPLAPTEASRARQQSLYVSTPPVQSNNPFTTMAYGSHGTSSTIRQPGSNQQQFGLDGLAQKRSGHQQQQQHNASQPITIDDDHDGNDEGADDDDPEKLPVSPHDQAPQVDHHQPSHSRQGATTNHQQQAPQKNSLLTGISSSVAQAAHAANKAVQSLFSIVGSPKQRLRPDAQAGPVDNKHRSALPPQQPDNTPIDIVRQEQMRIQQNDLEAFQDLSSSEDVKENASKQANGTATTAKPPANSMTAALARIQQNNHVEDHPKQLKDFLTKPASQLTRQTRKRAVSQQDPPPSFGAEEQPIVLSSDDERDEEKPPETTSGELANQTSDGSNGLRRSSRIHAVHAATKPSLMYQGLKMRYPADGSKNSVEVLASDLDRLEEEEFLNDTIIDFYIKYIEMHLEPQVRQRCYFFSTFFFKKLTEKVPARSRGKAGAQAANPAYAGLTADQIAHERVKSWTKNVDIFSKDFLFIPIHEGLHWSLVIICHPGNWHKQAAGTRGHSIIIHLDSMRNTCHSVTLVGKPLREYLQHEWLRTMQLEGTIAQTWRTAFPRDPLPEINKAKWMPVRSIEQLPQQDNHCDCGLYVLCYIEFFCYANPQSVFVEAFPFKDTRRGSARKTTHSDPSQTTLLQDPPIFLVPSNPHFLDKKWFSQENASGLRYYIRYLIHRMMSEQMSAADREAKQDQYLHLLQSMEHYEADFKARRIGCYYLKPGLYAHEQEVQAAMKADSRQTPAASTAILPGKTTSPFFGDNQDNSTERRLEAAAAAEARAGKQQEQQQPRQQQLTEDGDHDISDDDDRQQDIASDFYMSGGLPKNAKLPSSFVAAPVRKEDATTLPNKGPRQEQDSSTQIQDEQEMGLSNRSKRRRLQQERSGSRSEAENDAADLPACKLLSDSDEELPPPSNKEEEHKNLSNSKRRRLRQNTSSGGVSVAKDNVAVYGLMDAELEDSDIPEAAENVTPAAAASRGQQGDKDKGSQQYNDLTGTTGVKTFASRKRSAPRPLHEPSPDLTAQVQPTDQGEATGPPESDQQPQQPVCDIESSQDLPPTQPNSQEVDPIHDQHHEGQVLASRAPVASAELSSHAEEMKQQQQQQQAEQVPSPHETLQHHVASNNNKNITNSIPTYDKRGQRLGQQQGHAGSSSAVPHLHAHDLGSNGSIIIIDESQEDDKAGKPVFNQQGKRSRQDDLEAHPDPENPKHVRFNSPSNSPDRLHDDGPAPECHADVSQQQQSIEQGVNRLSLDSPPLPDGQEDLAGGDGQPIAQAAAASNAMRDGRTSGTQLQHEHAHHAGNCIDVNDDDDDDILIMEEKQKSSQPAGQHNNGLTRPAGHTSKPFFASATHQPRGSSAPSGKLVSPALLPTKKGSKKQAQGKAPGKQKGSLQGGCSQGARNMFQRHTGPDDDGDSNTQPRHQNGRNRISSAAAQLLQNSSAAGSGIHHQVNTGSTQNHGHGQRQQVAASYSQVGSGVRNIHPALPSNHVNPEPSTINHLHIQPQLVDHGFQHRTAQQQDNTGHAASIVARNQQIKHQTLAMLPGFESPDRQTYVHHHPHQSQWPLDQETAATSPSLLLSPSRQSQQIRNTIADIQPSSHTNSQLNQDIDRQLQCTTQPQTAYHQYEQQPQLPPPSYTTPSVAAGVLQTLHAHPTSTITAYRQPAAVDKPQPQQVDNGFVMFTAVPTAAPCNTKYVNQEPIPIQQHGNIHPYGNFNHLQQSLNHNMMSDVSITMPASLSQQPSIAQPAVVHHNSGPYSLSYCQSLQPQQHVAHGNLQEQVFARSNIVPHQSNQQSQQGSQQMHGILRASMQANINHVSGDVVNMQGVGLFKSALDRVNVQGFHAGKQVPVQPAPSQSFHQAIQAYRTVAVTNSTPGYSMHPRPSGRPVQIVDLVDAENENIKHFVGTVPTWARSVGLNH